MKEFEKEYIISELKKQIINNFPSIKIINEYEKNGTTIIEIYTPDKNHKAINDMSSKLSSEILINYGLDVLFLIYDNPEVLDWYVELENN
ncbi:MAG: hypothetical protein ACE5JB_08240 [bacterium]